MSQFKIKFIKDAWRDRAGLIIKQDKGDGYFSFLQFVFRPLDLGQEIEPAMMDDQAIEFMQAVCNAAYEAGIYPIQLKDKTDELTATKYHLEDMRQLALKGKK